MLPSMADFSSSSSSTPYESEIDQILAEAMDHCVLEQVAAINSSSFSDSLLPSHLETRFQKLKTFPPSSSSNPPRLAPDSANQSKNSIDRDDKLEKLPSAQSKVSNFGENSTADEGKTGKSPTGQSKVSNFEGVSGGGKGKKGNSRSGYVSSPSDSSSEYNMGSPNSKSGKNGGGEGKKGKISNFEGVSGSGKGKKGNSRGGYVSSPSDSSSECSPNLKSGKNGGSKGKLGNPKPRSLSFCSDSEEDTVGKNGGGGCLCFSPKRVSSKKKKKKKNGGGGGGGDELGLGFGWGKDEELLNDLRSFSSMKRMKEAMKEEEKINKEAEKIVKWAKQVSARMDFDISDDDHDDHHHH